MKKTWMIVGSVTLLCITSWLLVIVILFDPFSKKELTTLQGEESSSLFDVYGEHLSISHQADLLGLEEFEKELAADNPSSSTEISLESEPAEDKELKKDRKEEDSVESETNHTDLNKEKVTEEITTTKGIRPGDFSHIAPDGIISIEKLFEELSIEVE